MKKNYLLVFSLMVFLCAVMNGSLFAQASLPVYEAFDYLAGNLSGNAGWAATGSNTLSPVQVVDTSLTFTDLPDSVGRKVSVLNGSSYEDPGFDIVTTGNQSENSSIYASFIVNVVSPGSVEEYFFHVCSAGTGSTDFHSRVFVKLGAGGTGFYNIGIRNHNNDTPVYEALDRAVGTPIFVAVSYDFIIGDDNDTSRMWINTALGQSSPPAADLTATAVVANTDLAGAGRINLRQPSASTGLSEEVDELRVGTTWASVTPQKAGSGVNDWTLY